MEVELNGRRALVIGEPNAIASCVAAALEANGALVAWQLADDGSGGACDILIVSHDLTLGELPMPSELLGRATENAERLVASQSGRIVHLLSALGLVAMRRHVASSAAAAAIAASVRGQAMRLAPGILVNAVAAGPIGEGAKLAAGDPAMLSHVPLERPGTAQEVANAVLFLIDPANTYTTGQILAVDGGWTTGYGRNF